MKKEKDIELINMFILFDELHKIRENNLAYLLLGDFLKQK